MNKRLNEMDECFNTIREQVIGSVNEQLNNHIINVNKQVSETIKIQVHERINEICRETQRETDELRESVCVCGRQ